VELNYGLPQRMAQVLHAQFVRDGMKVHERKIDIIDELLCDEDRIPLTADHAAIYRAADKAARDCYRLTVNLKTVYIAKVEILKLCKALGVPMPTGETDTEILRRAVDKSWWVRNLHKEFLRRLEHSSIRLGLTGQGTGAYVSQEACLIQARQNRANQKLLESKKVTNGIDTYTLAELADLGMSNKTLRRGELMTRIRGFEEIATALNHTAMFWTITCPSKYHSVGGTNRKYSGATPRQAQKYLCKIWQRMRSAFNRAGIRPYGFRIAEPHTDGCPHWHMLFFVERQHAPLMEQIITAYALAEDGSESGAQENRVKLVRIETDNGKSAAAYIIKYVSKNIDGFGVGDHKAFENGETYTIKTDKFGQQEITPSQRVTYWSQIWGIRQFQQIGGAPVGVWRELRRVEAETILAAPYEVQEAWHAVQKGETVNPDGTTEVKQASWAEYLIAQGGVNVGRKYRIRIAQSVVVVEGKYATYEAKKPIGVYAVSEADEIFKSVRYVWTEVQEKGLSLPLGFGGTRTGVNNCTEPGANAPWVNPKPAPDWLKNKKFSSDVDDFVKRWKARE